MKDLKLLSLFCLCSLASVSNLASAKSWNEMTQDEKLNYLHSKVSGDNVVFDTRSSNFEDTDVGFGTNVSIGDNNKPLHWFKADGKKMSGNHRVILGYNNEVAHNSFAIGDSNKIYGSQSLALGYQSWAMGHDSIAMGMGAYALPSTEMKNLGYGARDFQARNSAIGENAVASAMSAAYGSSSAALGKFSLAMGIQAVAGGESADSFSGAFWTMKPAAKSKITDEEVKNVYKDYLKNIGYDGMSSLDQSTLLDNLRVAMFIDKTPTVGATSIGALSRAKGSYSLAVGVASQALADSGVALGGQSVADRPALTEETRKQVFLAGKGTVDSTTESTRGSASIGNPLKDGFNRQLTGVAAGTKDNDAVNVAQLKAVAEASAGNGVKYFSVNSQGGGNENNDGAKGEDSIAIGKGASTDQKALQAVAIGYGASAYLRNVALGSGAMSTKGGESLAMGFNARTEGNYTVALGSRSIAKESGVAIGPITAANSSRSIAVGYNARVGTAEDPTSNQSPSSIAIGDDSFVADSSSYSTAVGTGNIIKQSKWASAMGPRVEVMTSDNGVGLGFGSRVTEAYAGIAIGASAKVVKAKESIAIGTVANSTAPYGIALGPRTKAANENAIAIGSYANASAKNTVVVGHKADAKSFAGIALGQEAKTGDKNFSLAIGYQALSDGEQATAVGLLAKSSGVSSASFGPYAQATGNSALSLGSVSSASGSSSVAAGAGANAISNSSVALGARSVADTDAGVNGYDPITGKEHILSAQEKEKAKEIQGKITELEAKEAATTDKAEKEKITVELNKARSDYRAIFKTYQSLMSAVSVGSTKDNITRQITNVAAGTEDTDAVNVAQLKAVAAASAAKSVKYFSVNSQGGGNENNDGAKGVDSIVIGKDGVVDEKASDAVAIGHHVVSEKQNVVIGAESRGIRGHQNVSIGYDAEALGTHTVVIGGRSTANDGAVAIGGFTKVYGVNSVAIGTNVEIGAPDDGSGVYLENASITAIGDHNRVIGKSKYATSIGTSNLVDQSNMATALGGMIEVKQSPLAVSVGNGSKATDSAKGVALGSWAELLNAEESVAIGPVAYTTAPFAVALGSRTKSAGVNAIAVGHLANAAKLNSIAIGQNSNAKASSGIAIGTEANTGEKSFSTAIGYKALSDGEQSISIGVLNKATGMAATSLGSFASASGRLSTALGASSSAKVDNSVALGSDSVADVNAGVFGYDPLTGQQYVLSGSKKAKVDDLDAKIKELQDKAKATTDKAEKQKIEAEITSKQNNRREILKTYQSTSAAVSIGDRTNNITRQIINVAAGTEDTDAVNVAQLKQLREMGITFKTYSNNNLDKETGVVSPKLGDTLKIVGKDGIDVKVDKENIVIGLNSEEIAKNPALKGPKGDKGDKGDQGVAGPKGDKGDKGDQGVAGPKGDKGDKGDQGVAGPKGDKGDKGDQGVAGPKGDKGDKGDQGVAGPKGDKGNDGIKGKDGANGRGVKSVKVDLDGKLLVTYTDNKTENAGVIKGQGAGIGKEEVQEMISVSEGKQSGKLAQAVALGSLLPLDYDAEKPTQVSVGYGYQSGKSGFALGLLHYFNIDTLVHAGVALGSEDPTFRLGATFRLGSSPKYSSKKVSTTDYTLLKEIEVLRQNNTDLKSAYLQLEKRDAEKEARIRELEAMMKAILEKQK